MAKHVCAGACLECSFGMTPSVLNVLPINRVQTTTPTANIMDNKPLVNILPFGMCKSLANPTVAAATATALGVLTPMPCVPVIPAPWLPGATQELIGNVPALNDKSKCFCLWGGIINVKNSGQLTVDNS